MKKIFPLFLAAVLAGCNTLPNTAERLTTAQHIASQGQLLPRQFQVQGLTLQSFLKLGKTPQHVRLYLEGDGLAYINSHTPSVDPTPMNPTALRLAAVDGAANVIYLARPCQYTLALQPNCAQKYWTTHRYSAEVLHAYNSLLDDLKAKYGIQTFELVGFSGGGTIAALLAESRTDVIGLRTVAANLDVAVFTQFHHITPMTHSLDPAENAARLKSLPQLHYVGQDDSVVPAIVVRHFLEKQVTDADVVAKRLKVVQGMDHFAQWYRLWPKLLNAPLE